MRIQHLVLALAAAFSVTAQAADSINLGNYSVAATYSLDILGGTSGGISGLEGSAIAYARDRGTLFFVGDEGTGVVEISRTGQTLDTMAFNWTGTGSTKHDTEALTYVGGGVLVLGEERLQDAYKFSYSAGGSATLANSMVSMSNTSVGNNGMEGLSYDPRNGSFVSVIQQSPENILTHTLTFAAATGGLPAALPSNGASPTGGGTAVSAQLFNPALMGLSTLSDVQTLASVDSFAGSPAADHLLVLSLGSRKLIEVTRQGVVVSSLDLSNVLPNNGIEGVTIDENGTIYLVAEQYQPADGSVDLTAHSQLIILTAAVPEPESLSLMLAGLCVLPWVAARRRKYTAPKA
ncbi:PEP-CTERM sorting domain-containing protein [Rhodoferax lacus]|uniref:PEP-CTERM sorting domain-containing protein n=1 Tax=Rhodoferax lacus TaxID=2184758 RepID=A0A3E1R653_9BURK|nr:SdiA-regulated domain-containing protein [Rhodoferax lacus]RFO94846.1 PEP-CTERM sorting domain-containing protein [Rhodoferax lacus]